MATREMAEEALAKNPDMGIADLIFRLKSTEIADKGEAETELRAAIKEQAMAPLYAYCCTELGWSSDAATVSEMEEANAAELKRLEEVIKDAEENLGSSEVRDAYIAKGEHFSRIGARSEAESALRAAYDKTSSVGPRMDLTFHLCRLGMFFNDTDLVKRSIEKAEALLEEGGDWDRRNRLKVYKGVHLAAIRDFKQASEQLLSTVSTFTCTELLSYDDFIALTVLVAVVAEARPQLYKSVVKGPEINEVLHRLPLIKSYLNTLYDCDYKSFFTHLAEVETLLKSHRILAAHRAFYIREMRVAAYRQLLQSYRSVTLASMAESFGVSPSFMDKELSRFVAAGRLNCKIDAVGGVVETNRPDVKNAQYQETIKKGDVLLNRLQKLGQYINV